MRSMPVVLMDPRGEMLESIGGVLVETSIGPLSDGGLDESLCFAVSAGRVGPGESMLYALVAQGFAEQPVFVAGTVIGQHATDGEAESAVMGPGHEEEADGRLVALVGQDG